MPELPARVLTGLSRTTVAAACMLPLCGLPAGAWAQSVPPSLRACAAETDAGLRLDCYDREMKRLLAAPAQPSKPTAPAPAAKATLPAQQPASPAAAASSAAEAPSDTAAAAPKAAQASPAAPHHSAAWNIFGGGAASQVTAQVASVERSPDAMILHLDNGQVWRQIGRASGDLTLRAGDKVTIAKHLGSYWLSSRYISSMRVRQESQ